VLRAADLLAHRLPLARPALATVTLFTFIANWQDFLGPLVYLRDESMYTLSLGLQRFLATTARSGRY